MKWQLIIAWRNLWRNPRRTGVILVSVVVGIWMMLFFAAIMWGMVQSMLGTALASLTGHVQIHHPDFIADPAIEHRIEDPATLEKALSATLPDGAGIAWRVRLDVVANNARHSGGFTLVGTDFAIARETTFLGEARLSGRIPQEEDANGLLVGRELLEDYETKIGNKLILTARDSTGETASAAFRITGTFDTYLAANEKGFAFARRETVQHFLKLDEAVTEISITLPDIARTAEVTRALRNRLDSEDYTITPWEDRVPMVTAYLKIWDYFSFVWGAVVFAAMAFGLVNTLLMAVYERIREFGLVRALGMRPGRVLGGVLLESCLLLVVGLAIGNALAFAAIAWLGSTGINLAAFSASAEVFGLSRMIYPELQARDFFILNGMVLVLGVLVSLYPAWRAARFTPVEAMTHFN